jgi:transcriptional regulator with XRE-family HTH domain
MTHPDQPRPEPKPPRLSPGTYLRDARAAAGITLADLTAMMRLLNQRDLAASFGLLLGAIETDTMRPSDEELMALRLAFPFRPALYRQLCAEADAEKPTLPERTASHA